jgi:hypothetical protein
MIVLVLALGAVSEIVLLLTFAAMLTGIFHPMDRILRPTGPSPLGAGVVVWFRSPWRAVWSSLAPPLPGGFLGKVAGRAEPTLQRIFD